LLHTEMVYPPAGGHPSKYALSNGTIPDPLYTQILSIDCKQSPLQISRKVAVGVVKILEFFYGTHILGASRGRLCDSSAFLLAQDVAPVAKFSQAIGVLHAY